MYPICMLQLPPSPKFNSRFSSTASGFWVTGQFVTSAPNDPKWPWILNGQMYPTRYTCYNYLRVRNFTLWPAVFYVTGQFETSAPNDPQITLNTKSSTVTHICGRSTPEFQFHSVHSTESSFLVTGHFDTWAPNDPKWPSTLNGQTYPVYTL